MINSRKSVIIALSIVCSVVHLSMSWSPLGDHFGILDHEDYSLANDQDKPVLHSVNGDFPQWESYNQWICFPAENVQFGCFDDESNKWEDIESEERDGRGYYAVINVDHDGHHYQLEAPSRVFPERCLEEIEQTKRLIEGQPGFCVFAAKLPSEEELGGTDAGASSLWVAYGAKSPLGQVVAPIYDRSAMEEVEHEF